MKLYRVLISWPDGRLQKYSEFTRRSAADNLVADLEKLRDVRHVPLLNNSKILWKEVRL